MMLPFLSRQFGIDRDHRSKLRRLEAGFEGLESRIALSGGSVVQTGALVTVTPASSGPSLVVVSHGLHNGVSMLDVNLNGTDNFFALNQVGFVYDRGSGCSGAQTFENTTSLHTVFWGGSGTNVFTSEATGQDEFFGGSGSNVFNTGLGYDVFFGGSGSNVFNENPGGSGIFDEVGSSNTVNGSYPSYVIYT